jgi:hypothetical protein
MANTGFLSVSELSFDGIKQNLKTFLKSKTEFKDYDFEGSNLNALIDLLSYNSYMNAYYLNMIGSEMFLDSAQIKNSVVSHAKELNYLPRSRTSARALVSFTVNTGQDTPPTVTIPENYTTRAVVDNTNLDFTTDETLVLTYNGVSYTSDPVYIYEGKIVNEFFNVADGVRYIINSENVDTNSIKVTVVKSTTDSSNSVYTYAENLYGLDSNSEIYFIQGYGANQYEIIFGDGILGKKLTNGNIVNIKYRSTNGELGNKAYTFTPTTKVENGLYSVAVSTNTPAADGSERETIESIKYNAPRHFASQNRAVTKDDYKNIIIESYPQIKTVNVYGGELADPPQYGKVIISMIPYGSNPIVASELKTNIITYLKTKSITTEPVIIDPEYLYVEVVSDVRYDPTLTSKSLQQLKTEVISKIQEYSDLYLTDFGNDLRKSRLSSMIDEADPAIISNQTYLRAIYRTAPPKGISQRLSFSFSNPLYRPFKKPYIEGEEETVRSDFFTYLKDNVSYNARISDNGEGLLRLYYLTPDSKQIILNENIGTVNYDTGAVVLDITVQDYINYIDFYAITLNDDIVVQESKYLKIDFSKLLISINVVRQ